MIRAAGSVDLAHARLWAAFGALPDELAWMRVEIVRELPAFLDAARTTSLSRWTRGVGGASDAHAIEHALRAHWREAVAAVASWAPEPWQPGIAWAGTVLQLPLLDHLSRGGDAPAWLRDGAESPEPLAGDSERAAKVRLVARSAAPAAQWDAIWWDLLPARARTNTILAALRATVLADARALRAPGAVSSPASRQRLRERLAILFRRAVLDPAAGLVYLAIVAIDVERLRGELVRRAAFGPARLAA